MNNHQLDNTTISPVDWVIKEFNTLSKNNSHPAQVGVGVTARLLGIDKANVTRWRRNGEIPKEHQKKILELARKYGLDITADDLIMGRDVD